ncbi:ATP-dependent DNA ligase [candidate division WOR-3 bacterium RBG_13_43_14]|uniref:ATP-dependent DNA ligase n=1 Tax=candidate division WOR-3 bacterium RBG_13_43_14 TaxID=1802590 RepID=A0A1F4UAE9_UNCW3|nr:MAG: ATP-dependent DNA ligase [candidate division WOR-3 bacterium RBG_13_43_14]
MFSILMFALIVPLFGHFQMIIPSSTIVEPGSENISIDLRFCHPFEGDILNMVRPSLFGVMIKGEEREDLLSGISRYDIDGLSAWKMNYRVKNPGDHIFFVEPQPYWEPAEEVFIIHYTKVVVHAFGMEKGWDAEIGLSAEIMPLTRPYGLYTGNIFTGMVKLNGKPAPNIDVEVEYYNDAQKYKAPAGPFVTQIIRTDISGIFHYAMPCAGWWGFAALGEADEKMRNPQDQKDYPVELGAVFWVQVINMKQ